VRERGSSHKRESERDWRRGQGGRKKEAVSSPERDRQERIRDEERTKWEKKKKKGR
jgi:hypothetical protein